MHRISRIGPAALAGAVLLSLSLGVASAGDLELAAKNEQFTPDVLGFELEQAGFYAVGTTVPGEDPIAEAIADFEHHVGWPETGEPSPAILSAVRHYNAQSEAPRTEF